MYFVGTLRLLCSCVCNAVLTTVIAARTLVAPVTRNARPARPARPARGPGDRVAGSRRAHLRSFASLVPRHRLHGQQRHAALLTIFNEPIRHYRATTRETAWSRESGACRAPPAHAAHAAALGAPRCLWVVRTSCLRRAATVTFKPCVRNAGSVVWNAGEMPTGSVPEKRVRPLVKCIAS